MRCRCAAAAVGCCAAAADDTILCLSISALPLLLQRCRSPSSFLSPSFILPDFPSAAAEFEEAKGEVILKYSADEARQLKAEGALPPHVTINDTAIGEAGAAEERGFEFGAGGDSDDDESSDGEVDVDAI